MAADAGDGGAVSQGRTTIHGAHMRTLEAVFRHPPAQNLEWMDVVSLVEKIGSIHTASGNGFSFAVGSEGFLIHKPHTKNLSASDVVDLRHFLQRSGWSPTALPQETAHPERAAPDVVVAIDHHGASVYRIDAVSGDGSKREIRPGDPRHFLRHLTHKGQSGERGQRALEDPGFYEAVAEALAAGVAIVVVDHGTGKSNAGRHLIEYLRAHHRQTYLSVVREVEADLSAITAPQLLALARQALDAASLR